MTMPPQKTPLPTARAETYAPPQSIERVEAPRSRSRRPAPLNIGLVFLLLTIFGFAALAAALPHYTLSATARRGLTYDTLFAELHDALVDAPDRPLRRAIRAVAVDAQVATPDGIVGVTFDTLAVVDSSGTYPSLLPAGFLRDQVDTYNAFQRDRLDAIRRGRFVARARFGMYDLRGTDNPSMFRTEVREGAEASGDRDSIALAERAVPYALRVPSPFDAARLVAVTTREWARNLAWISSRGTESVAEGRGQIPGEPACPFRSIKDSVYVECTAPGSPFAQLVLRFPDRLGEMGTATQFSGDRTFYDGAVLPRLRPVPIGTGGMFQFQSRALGANTGAGRARAEPVVLEWALGGTLGGTQWINGRIQWQPSVTRMSAFVKQLASASGFGASVELEGGRNIPLSLDEGFTDDLQRQLDEFVGCELRSVGCGLKPTRALRCGPRGKCVPKMPTRALPAARSPHDIAFATIVIASLKTGEILGVAEYGEPTAGAQSWLLRPVNVGSAIKPVLAAAALMRRPELATLEIRNDGPTMDDVWGLRLERSFEAGGSCPIGWIDLRRFLSCSSNRYAAALVAAALQPDDDKRGLRWDPAPGIISRLDGKTQVGRRPHLPLDNRRRIRAEALNESALAAGLFALDSLNTSIELATLLGREGRDSSVWTGLHDDRMNSVRAPVGLWPEQSRLGLSRGGRPAGMRQLAMFAVGAAENRVTTIDLTEVFGRIMTDRRLALTFVPSRFPQARQASFSPLGLSNTSWYPALTGGLRDVGRAGTAKGMADMVARQLSADVVFYGKTGTLNAPPHVRVLRRVDTVTMRGAAIARTTTVVDTIVPPVVAKTLVFAVGPPPSFGRRAPSAASGTNDSTGTSARNVVSTAALQCGLVGTVYFRLRRNPPQVESLSTEFANERLWAVLRRNWDRLQVCREKGVRG